MQNLIDAYEHLAAVVDQDINDSLNDLDEYKPAQDLWPTTNDESKNITSFRSKLKLSPGKEFRRVRLGSQLKKLIGDLHSAVPLHDGSLLFEVEFVSKHEEIVDIRFHEFHEFKQGTASFNNSFLDTSIAYYHNTPLRRIFLYTSQNGDAIICLDAEGSKSLHSSSNS